MSSSMLITVNMVVVSVLIVIFMLYITQGLGYARYEVNSLTRAVNGAYETKLLHVSNYGAVPAVTAYLALQENADIVGEISGDAYGVTVENAADLMKLFDKKIRLEISEFDDPEDPDSGKYTVAVKEE